MTAPTAPPNSRPVLTGALVAAGIGVAVGLIIDLAWPNTVYGYQLVAGGLAIAIAVLAGIVPGLRRWLPAAAGLAIGMIAGMAIGLSVFKPASSGQPGTATVRLDTPAMTWPAGPALCVVDGDQLQYLDTTESNLQLPADRRIELTVARGEYSPIGAAPQDTGIGMVARIYETQPDGPATETIMGSGAVSKLEMSGTAASGSLRFSGLVLHPESEEREPIDVAGTISWECPAGP